MKSMNRLNEKGSAHVIIISLLSVALLGAVGLLFWQNFLQPKPTEKTNSVVVSKDESKAKDTDKEEPKKDPNEGYLVLDAWSIRFKPTNTAKVSYEQKDGDYWFTTETWRNFGGICDTHGGVRLTRMTEKSTVIASPPQKLNGEEKIGNYYYYFSGPQSSCSDDNYGKEAVEYEAIKELLVTIEAKK